MTAERPTPTKPPIAAAMFWLAACQETAKPRRPGGEASSRKAVVGPTSPPSENPWVMRARIARIGAAMPIVA